MWCHITILWILFVCNRIQHVQTVFQHTTKTNPCLNVRLVMLIPIFMEENVSLNVLLVSHQMQIITAYVLKMEHWLLTTNAFLFLFVQFRWVGMHCHQVVSLANLVVLPVTITGVLLAILDTFCIFPLKVSSVEEKVLCMLAINSMVGLMEHVCWSNIVILCLD